MKILLINSHLNPGGITRYVIHLAAELQRRGHQVIVASSGGEWEEQFRKKRIAIKKIPLKTKSIVSCRIWVCLFLLMRYLKDYPADIVHGNNRVSQWLAFLLAKCTGVAYVNTFHGFYKPHYLRRVLSCAGSKSIAITHATAEHMREDLKIPDDTIRVVYNGTDASDFRVSLSADEIRNKYGIQGSPVIGVMARLAPEKNHKVMIEAMTLLVRVFPKAVLLITGRGRMEEALKSMVHAKGLEGSVIFLKYVPAGEIFAVMDVCVHPADSEGFGLAITEAQFLGVPVIGCNLGGVKEIVLNGQTGLLLENPYDAVELYEKLVKLLRDDALRRQMADRARDRARELFSIQSMADGTLRVYQEILKS